MESLAQFRGRNQKFARDIIVDAKAVEAKKAYEEKAIDLVFTNLPDFLEFAQGKKVRGPKEETAQQLVQVGPMRQYPPDFRHDLLQILSNPQWSYLLFMGSMGLLYFEITHPGTLVPGVIGALGLVISLVNFHWLDVSWGGVALLFLGLVFLLAELFVPSFGALGLGGLTSFIVGSLFLFDEKTGIHIPLGLLIATCLVLFFFIMTLSYLSVRATQRGKENRKKESPLGVQVVVKEFSQNEASGLALYRGELWKVVSEDLLVKGDRARVVSEEGLTLKVKKES